MTARVRSYFTNIGDRDVILLLLGFFVGAVTVSLVSHSLSQSVNLWVWADSFFQNFGTEMFGAFLTFLLIEVLVSGRRQREVELRERLVREASERKTQLIWQMGSRDNPLALQGVAELRAAGWLTDGTLRGAFLRMADLSDADLAGADLQGVYLDGANLRGTNLRGADLMWARQGHPQYGPVLFNQATILPDGTTWTPETDMSRFTDPAHLEFWRPVDQSPPTFRVDDDNREDD
jgi:hypothetical protein